MFGLALGVAAGLGKLGYDLWKSSDAKSERRQFSDYQYHQYLNSLREAPSAQRKGLEDAGYNPMLALGSVGGSSFSGSALSDSSGSPPDFLSSAKQARDLVNDIKRKQDEESDIRKAEANKIKAEADKIRSSVKVDRATIDKLESDTLNTDKDTWFNNPVVDGVTGILGYKAAEKVGGLLGGSAKGVANNSVLKGIEKASKLPKGIPAAKFNLGSSLLRGLALPSLIGSAGAAYYEGSKAYPEYSDKVKKGIRKEVSGFGLPVVY